MASKIVPKQRILTENETVTTFENWKNTMLFQITLDPKFARFVDSEDLSTWSKVKVLNRGFVNDKEGVDANIKMSAVAKAASLQILLGSLAHYAPVISNKFIVHQATSITEIFDRLRAHYGFRHTGGKITELTDFRLEPSESREALWERMYGFLEDSLLNPDYDITHDNQDVTEVEEFSPTLLNVLVVLWLNTIHHSLPALVRQRFATDLRDQTIYSIRDEISDAIPALLGDLSDREGISISASFQPRQRKQQRSPKWKSNKPNCILCETAGRPSNHFLSKCTFLPNDDKNYMSKIREVIVEEESDEEEEACQSKCYATSTVPSFSKTSRVKVSPAPYLNVTVNKSPCIITLDCGAESNLILQSECIRMGMKVQPTTQRAFQADGTTPLNTIGETHTVMKFKHHNLKFDALVVGELNAPVLAGQPFLEDNDISLRPYRNLITIGDCCKVNNIPRRSGTQISTNAVSILRVPVTVCLLPGENVSLPVPDELICTEVAVEPHSDRDSEWLKCRLASVESNMIIKNESRDPVILKKHDQICNLRPVIDPESMGITSIQVNKITLSPDESSNANGSFSSAVSVDPSCVLSTTVKQRFLDLNREFDDVFSPTIGLYNGYSGPFKHTINMSPSLPPQRKGRIPMYNRSNMVQLQEKIDELHIAGVLAKPEDIDIHVEYSSPSFLVSKKTGGHRLVTSFTEIGQYIKTPPSLMPCINDTLRSIGRWKYLVKADLKQAYFQIPLDRKSMKFVGVSSPFKGTYVYQRSVMGLAGSETALEELLCKVLGGLIMKGNVIKTADDLYCGAETPEELIKVWREVLHALLMNGLKLSPEKTVCCPTSVVVLGWLWENGTLRATPHRLNALEMCSPPETVRALRSYVGAYKYLSNVLPSSANKLHHLDLMCSNSKSPSEKIVWTDKLLESFNASKTNLKNAKTIALPRPEEHLQIITDAAMTEPGLAAAMYVIRKDKPRLAGIFNAGLKKHQSSWLPCEIEALSLSAAVKHFSPYIIQSHHKTVVLTDSKPCVEAFKKLCRGQFSASSRVSTFLSTMSRFGVEVKHISGKDNVVSDYLSRNIVPCNGVCKICNFINEIDATVVQNTTVSDILSGHCPLPYASRAAWIEVQQQCYVLSEVKELLKDGRSPARKKRGKVDVRRYLNTVKLSEDGLLYVPRSEPLRAGTQRIVVPRGVADGLMTALHLKLQHPSKFQLGQVFSRQFFCLDIGRLLERTVNTCHFCASLLKIPSRFKPQSSSPPEAVGCRYAADVIRRYSQFILVMREDVTSMTDAMLINDETGSILKDGVMQLSSRFRAPTGPAITVRVDSATGFQSVVADTHLTSIGITLELGEPKNINRNPVAEKSISELEAEISRIQPSGGKITDLTLAMSVANMNSRIRGSGHTALEMWTRRDMHTREPLNLSDEILMKDKYEERLRNHLSSSKYKARGKTQYKLPSIVVGDIVYIYDDRDKTKAREGYLVTALHKDKCVLQKLTGSQFRKKKYTVSLYDVFKPDVQVEPNQPRSKSISNPIPEDTVPLEPERDTISKARDETLTKVTQNGESIHTVLEDDTRRKRRNVCPPHRLDYQVMGGDN